MAVGGTSRVCTAVGMPRSSYYRINSPSEKSPRKERPKPQRALNEVERQEVLAVLSEDRFVDKVPAEIYSSLLDEGRYLCSISSMYRILHSVQAVRERRNQLSHPHYEKPELLATGPNQVWSWDITKVKGPAKWNHYYLYVIIDIYSRLVVGWMIASRETGKLAKALMRSVRITRRNMQNQARHLCRGFHTRRNEEDLCRFDRSVPKGTSRELASCTCL